MGSLWDLWRGGWIDWLVEGVLVDGMTSCTGNGCDTIR
jgi:hypothetical protein